MLTVTRLLHSSDDVNVTDVGTEDDDRRAASRRASSTVTSAQATSPDSGLASGSSHSSPSSDVSTPTRLRRQSFDRHPVDSQTPHCHPSDQAQCHPSEYCPLKDSSLDEADLSTRTSCGTSPTMGASPELPPRRRTSPSPRAISPDTCRRSPDSSKPPPPLLSRRVSGRCGSPRSHGAGGGRGALCLNVACKLHEVTSTAALTPEKGRGPQQTSAFVTTSRARLGTDGKTKYVPISPTTSSAPLTGFSFSVPSVASSLLFTPSSSSSSSSSLLGDGLHYPLSAPAFLAATSTGSALTSLSLPPSGAAKPVAPVPLSPYSFLFSHPTSPPLHPAATRMVGGGGVSHPLLAQPPPPPSLPTYGTAAYLDAASAAYLAPYATPGGGGTGRGGPHSGWAEAGRSTRDTLPGVALEVLREELTWLSVCVGFRALTSRDRASLLERGGHALLLWGFLFRRRLRDLSECVCV